MSDTPRTEAEVNRQKCWSEDLITIDANFACQLERELNAANQRIKRLEEALESIRERWNRDNNERAMEDACWHAINTAAEALEAKEAKP